MIDIVRAFLVCSLALNFLLFAIVLWQDKQYRLSPPKPPRCPDCGRLMDSFCEECAKYDA